MGYNVGKPIVTDGLILHLDAGNTRSYVGAGTTWYDISGGNSGALLNGVAFNTSNNGIFLFDGVNDTVSLGDKLNIGLSNWTVSAWIKNTIKQFGRIVSKNNSGPDGWWISLENTGAVSIGLDNVWGTASSFDATTQGWINVVGVWNRNGFANIYSNSRSLGNIVDISSKSSSDLQTNFDLRVGSRASGSAFYNGALGDVLIYNRALTQSEITQNYEALRGRYGI